MGNLDLFTYRKRSRHCSIPLMIVPTHDGTIAIYSLTCASFTSQSQRMIDQRMSDTRRSGRAQKNNKDPNGHKTNPSTWHNRICGTLCIVCVLENNRDRNGGHNKACSL